MEFFLQIRLSLVFLSVRTWFRGRARCVAKTRICCSLLFCFVLLDDGMYYAYLRRKRKMQSLALNVLDTVHCLLGPVCLPRYIYLKIWPSFLNKSSSSSSILLTCLLWRIFSGPDEVFPFTFSRRIRVPQKGGERGMDGCPKKLGSNCMGGVSWP